MNTYRCDKCPWQYVWTMGDRVKAVKRHELAHLLERPAPATRHAKRGLDLPSNQLLDYIQERLQNVEFV